MNPLDAASTEDKSQERTTKSFLYSNFTDHRKRKKKGIDIQRQRGQTILQKGQKIMKRGQKVQFDR
jgi:hypothetical protein